MSLQRSISRISADMECGEISAKEARLELCDLFGVKYKPKVSGRVLVRSRSKKLIYDGLQLPIIGIYTEYRNGDGGILFPDGTREYKVSLKGTEWSNREFATIVETDLVILELNED